MEINRLRTPPHQNNDRIYFDEDDRKEDRCNIHIAEIYTMNKRIEFLNKELEEKVKSETILKKNLEEYMANSEIKINELNNYINEQKFLVEDLLNKNKVLENAHSYADLIEYFENKLNEAHLKNLKNFQNFSNKSFIASNREDVWRNLIKKYEEKIVDLEKQIETFSKSERKIYSRQKFFEKYCFKAEEKIENYSKASKKFYDQEKLINELKIELEQKKNEIKTLEEVNNKISTDREIYKKENEKTKSFIDKIKPILKVDWNEIRINNRDNYDSILKNSLDVDNSFESSNIIILVDNLNNFLHLIRDTVKALPDLTGVIQIVYDIRSYLLTLLNKIQVMSINQYNLINTCCDLNDRVRDHLKKNKMTELKNIFTDIKNTCTKMLFDFSPKV